VSDNGVRSLSRRLHCNALMVTPVSEREREREREKEETFNGKCRSVHESFRESLFIAV